MPIPKNITFVTFDVYGTLIDWETGIYEAFTKEAERDGFEIDRSAVPPRLCLHREERSGEHQRILRQVGLGGQILSDLNIRKIRLLSNTPTHVPALQGFNLEIVDQVGLALAKPGARQGPGC